MLTRALRLHQTKVALTLRNELKAAGEEKMRRFYKWFRPEEWLLSLSYGRVTCTKVKLSEPWSLSETSGLFSLV